MAIAASTWTDVPNDANGGNTYLDAGEPNLGNVWDASAQSFDFSAFENNSRVDIRLDLEVTTSAPNQIVDVYLYVADGTGFEFSVPFITGLLRDAGVHRLTRFSMIYLRDAIKSLPARFKIYSDASLDLKVNGWVVSTFIKV